MKATGNERGENCSAPFGPFDYPIAIKLLFFTTLCPILLFHNIIHGKNTNNHHKKLRKMHFN